MFAEWLKILSECELFSNLHPDELSLVLECLKPKLKHYEKDELIALSGESFTGLAIVLSGEIVISKENSAGNRVILAVLEPGEIFGEMAAFSGSNVWPATVVSRTGSLVMYLSIENLMGLCEAACLSHRQITLNILRIISHKAIMLNRKVEYLSIKSLRGKISAYLLEQCKMKGNPTFNIPMKRNELADFLNVSRPSLSREMCRLRDEGIIDFHRESIKIRDTETLKRLVD